MSYTLIWDLDGTLIDSYPLIVDKLVQLEKMFGKNTPKEEILEFVKMETVGLFAENTGGEEASSKLSEIQSEVEIVELPNATKMLEATKNKGVRHFIYTHSGNFCLETLDNLKLLPYFDEVVTSDYEFESKPHPQALDYLIEKYDLDKDKTFYVGDRSIDIECANNAGVKSIFYGIERHLKGTPCNHVVDDLYDIVELITE